VTVRAYPSIDSTTLVVLNNCPWPAQTEVKLELTRAAELQWITPNGARSSTPTSGGQLFAAGQQTWSLSLAPYEVQIVRLTAGARVGGVTAQLSDAALAELETQLTALSRRDLTRRSPYDRLANAGFEAIPGTTPISGWRLADERVGVTAELDATAPQEGKTSLYLASRGQLATVESELLPTPLTGQLFMTVWLRGENLAPTTAVRMVFQTEGAGQFYRTFADPKSTHPLTSDWVFYGFHVSDLPLESTGQMRVKFELDGPGEVWVDDVKLYDLLFPEPRYEHSTVEKRELLIMLSAAEKARQEGRISDSVRILEGYWPQFLLAYTEPIAERPAIARQPVTGETPTNAAGTEGPPPPDAVPWYKRIFK
jgi:hypothetical protein